MGMRIAVASVQDLDAVLGLIDEAAAWLRTKDTDQWFAPWPNEAARDAQVLRSLQRQATWIVWDDDIPAATVTMRPRHDPRIWARPAVTADLGERAVYLDRLVVARSYAGWGLGAQLIDWAGLQAWDTYGAKWIRINVWSTNSALHDYFLKRGFQPCGHTPDPDFPEGALFEKPTAKISAIQNLLFEDTRDYSRESLSVPPSMSSAAEAITPGTAVAESSITSANSPQAFYDSLGEAARPLWRRASLLGPSEELSPEVAAVLLDTDVDSAASVVDDLRSASVAAGIGPDVLVDPDYTLFASERLDDEDTTELDRTEDRLLRWRAEKNGKRPKPALACDSPTTKDLLGNQQYADAIAAFIRHQDTMPPLTIGIRGAWGAGKTSLMRMIREELDPLTSSGTRCRIQLTVDSRKKIQSSDGIVEKTPSLRYPSATSDSEPEIVRNRDVLRQLRHPVVESDPRGLHLETEPGGGRQQRTDEWRPTVWFNPWMYQSSEQIWAGLAHEIISQVTARMPRGDRERFWLRLNRARIDPEAVRRKAHRLLLERLFPAILTLGFVGLLILLAWVMARLLPHWDALIRSAAATVASLGTAAAVAGGLVQTARFLREPASRSFTQMVREPAALSRSTSAAATDLLIGAMVDPGYQARTGFLHLVQTDMHRVLDLVATPTRPLVVFVDDLDRCTPGPVVQVIEAINLFLAGEFPNCIFVLAMEPDVLAAHIETSYKDLAEMFRHQSHADSGQALGWRFLEKIIQLPLSLPALRGLQRDAYVRGLFHLPATKRPDEAAIDVGVTRELARDPADAHERDAGPVQENETLASKPSLQQPIDLRQVKDLEEAIWARNPDLDSLQKVARDVQAMHLGITSDRLSPAAIVAVERVFTELYRDSLACDAIEKGIQDFLGPATPREIKRYINLFRFYTFITYRQRLDGGPDVSAEQIAKLAVLAIRWPNLLTFLTLASSNGQTPLEVLEHEARDTEDAWLAALVSLDLTSPTEGNTGPLEKLRQFLQKAPDIAESAARLL